MIIDSKFCIDLILLFTIKTEAIEYIVKSYTYLVYVDNL